MSNLFYGKYGPGPNSSYTKGIDEQDARTLIAEAFLDIARAAQRINDVLGEHDALNDSVPANWPLSLSADEFAAECRNMSRHYRDTRARRMEEALKTAAVYLGDDATDDSPEARDARTIIKTALEDRADVLADYREECKADAQSGRAED